MVLRNDLPRGAAPNVRAASHGVWRTAYRARRTAHSACQPMKVWVKPMKNNTIVTDGGKRHDRFQLTDLRASDTIDDVKAKIETFLAHSTKNMYTIPAEKQQLSFIHVAHGTLAGHRNLHWYDIPDGALLYLNWDTGSEKRCTCARDLYSVKPVLVTERVWKPMEACQRQGPAIGGEWCQSKEHKGVGRGHPEKQEAGKQPMQCRCLCRHPSHLARWTPRRPRCAFRDGHKNMEPRFGIGISHACEEHLRMEIDGHCS